METQSRTLADEKLVWDLDKQAGPVPGLRVASASPAMRQIDQDLNTLQDDVVAFLAANARNKP